ncbi:MAG: hypothetical protein H7A23_25610 [Leptospiraceae bacterium]|nr:hypothetical protein [Leptospiraceae bacterium]
MPLSKAKIVSLFAYVFGAISVWGYRWVCDDAFVSFRYAKNLVNGYGLVYNVGEYVEGYTNFLWTLLIAAGLKLNLEPILFSEVMSLLFFTGTCYFLFCYYLHFNSKYPIGIFGFALHHHVQIFSTGGLETSLYTFLLVAGCFFCISSEKNTGIISGLALLLLAALTRPDGILFLAFATVYFLWKKSRSYREWIYILFPAFLYALFLVWRYVYYGSLVPNTFYAKSGYGSYWEQGFRYLKLYFLAYYQFFLIPVLLAYYLIRLKGQVFYPQVKKTFFIILVPTIIYILYYTGVGGDFMFARFFIPITPFFYLLFEYFNNILFQKERIQWVFFTIILLSTVLYYNPYKGLALPLIDGIAEENKIYKRELVNQVKKRLETWKDVFQKKQIRIAIGGSQAIFAYYLDTYALEAVTGLTDKHIASQHLFTRKRIGHEKLASIDYMREKNVHLLMADLGLPGESEYNTFYYKNLPGKGRIIIYDSKIMGSLQELGEFEFIPFEKYLDNYLQNAKYIRKDVVQSDFLEFQKYYFDHNDDKNRKQAFLNLLK